MDFVSVAIRIKPSLNNETAKSVELVSQEPPIIIVPERKTPFSFDNIFDEDSTQENVYKNMVRPLVEHIVNGYNSTIFAYGQTGTGKTFTIGSDPSYLQDHDTGLISRALNDIMLWEGDQAITTHISFIEIYNEKVYDLLGNNKTALQIKGFNVSGVTKHLALTLRDAELLLIEGGRNRHTGETKQNLKSSRSHAIFTIYCNVKHLGKETKAKLNLVDLAGSESVKKTGNEGSQLHEGININKGLLCIGRVITALSSNQSYIPYRESTITTILQDSLNKNNYVTLIACIGTKIDDLVETVQTLVFAQGAKKVRNKPEMNSIVGEYTKNVCTNITSRKIPPTPRTPFRPVSQNLVRRQPLHATSNLTNTFSSTIQELPESISPIVKRCVEEVGSKILSSMESIVKEHMTPAQEKAQDSPRISRRSLERVVKQIVRDNLRLHNSSAHETFRDAAGGDRDRSTCRFDNDAGTEKENHVDVAHVASALQGGTSPNVAGNMTPTLFKKPFVPLRIVRASRRTFAASSPIEEIRSPVKLRRSMRISSRNMSIQTYNCNEYNTPKQRRKRETFSEIENSKAPRRSARLSMNVADLNLRKSPPRKSVRQSVTRKRVVGKTKKSNQSIDPPIDLADKQHTVKVLNMLNDGTLKTIMSLSSIGSKYATMILQFRELKGRFRKISDLRQMPWRGNGYQNFLTTNFLIPGTP